MAQPKPETVQSIEKVEFNIFDVGITDRTIHFSIQNIGNGTATEAQILVTVNWEQSERNQEYLPKINGQNVNSLVLSPMIEIPQLEAKQVHESFILIDSGIELHYNYALGLYVIGYITIVLDVSCLEGVSQRFSFSTTD